LIDFIKYQLINTSRHSIESNSLLDFHSKVNLSTGELGIYSNAYYKGLEFKLYNPTQANSNGRITVEGSLHKFWNNGAHNFNDFGLDQINLVLNELSDSFNIQPENCRLINLELGVNINPPLTTKNILQRCIMHKKDVLKSIYTKDEGNYIQSKKQRHVIKLYDKKTHYLYQGFNIKEEIMRVEIKFSKMYQLNQLGIFTLSDLLNYGLSRFKTQLIKEWDNVIFYDKNALKGTKYEHQYSSNIYWQGLTKETYKYHRNNLRDLVSSTPNNIHKSIRDLIEEKIVFLNEKTTLINRLYIPLFKEVYNTKDRRFCKVTGLNISMQKEGSFLLSHTGLNYYFNSDKKVYDEVKRKYLTDRWENKSHPIQIREIAHNIRTKKSNRTVKQRRLYPPHQIQMFD
jgi:hypothetical protein